MTLKPSLDSSCVLALDFEESSGSTAYDISGKNNHGTIYGATRTYGKIGRGIYFDGAGDYVQVPNSSSLNVQELTITAWVKVMGSGTGVWQAIVQKYSYPLGGYALYRHSLHNSFYFIVRTSSDSFTDGLSTTHPDTDKWYFVVATRDSQYLRLCVNGVKEVEKTNPVVPAETTLSLELGRWGTASLLNAVVDEVRIYNRALTDREILELYEYGRGLLRQRVRPMYARR